MLNNWIFLKLNVVFIEFPTRNGKNGKHSTYLSTSIDFPHIHHHDLEII